MSTPKKSPQAIQKEIIILAIITQLDALAGALADPCCLTNYYGGQRQDIIDSLKRFTIQRLTDVAGLEIEYDITGSNYKEDDSDLPLVGDTFDVMLTQRTHTTSTFPLWNAHLKYELRGLPDSLR